VSTTPTELAERLREAAEIVKQAELPEPLQPVAYERVLDTLGVTTTTTTAPPSNTTTAVAGTGSDAPAPPGEPATRAGMLAQIASRLGLDPSLAARIYEEEGGQLRLILRKAMLLEPERKAASMRHVALLLVVGRQAAGLEEHTPYDAIREECLELKVYDRPNFATEIGKLEFRTTGPRNSREARANRHHYDDAAQLIRQITQGADS
jgi:hypothetical protein